MIIKLLKMMEEELEKIMKLAGNKNRYQYFMWEY